MVTDISFLLPTSVRFYAMKYKVQIPFNFLTTMM